MGDRISGDRKKSTEKNIRESTEAKIRKLALPREVYLEVDSLVRDFKLGE